MSGTCGGCHSLISGTAFDFLSIYSILLRITYQKIALVLSTLILAGCAVSGLPGGDSPIVDMKGVNQKEYDADLAECNKYTKEIEVGKQVIVGATSGAVIGAAVGAVADDSGAAKRTAGVGAILGTTKQTTRALNQRNRVLKRCLKGRGYRVLN